MIFNGLEKCADGGKGGGFRGKIVNLGMGSKYDHTGKNSFVNEPSAMRFYSSQEEQELERLREDMSRTDTEKFHRLMGLMKLGRMMKNAIIHHKD